MPDAHQPHKSWIRRLTREYSNLTPQIRVAKEVGWYQPNFTGQPGHILESGHILAAYSDHC